MSHHRIFAILTFGPVVLWVLAIVITVVLSAGLGCEINEGGAYPCPFLGFDVGKFAATTGIFAAWGALIIGPVSLGFALMWGIVSLIRAGLRRRRRQP